MTTGSPMPPIPAPTYMNMGRGWKWYLVQQGSIVGGPYASAWEGFAEQARWLRELSEMYDYVEERARRDGVTVCW